MQEIRELDKKKVKTVGISFGHQAIAQALGGHVGRNPKVFVYGAITCLIRRNHYDIKFNVCCSNSIMCFSLSIGFLLMNTFVPVGFGGVCEKSTSNGRWRAGLLSQIERVPAPLPPQRRHFATTTRLPQFGHQ